MPNVGKSTLFNCLSNAKAQSANFPFCTIEPNVGVITVPDERLTKLAEIVQPQRIVPTTVEIVDIAGLVKGASKGEGLGNKFLANIRETDAILHVLRCFDDDNITHVDGSVDPLRDKAIIDTELQLKDLETVEARIQKVLPMRLGSVSSRFAPAPRRRRACVVVSARPTKCAGFRSLPGWGTMGSSAMAASYVREFLRRIIRKILCTSSASVRKTESSLLIAGFEARRAHGREGRPTPTGAGSSRMPPAVRTASVRRSARDRCDRLPVWLPVPT